MLQKNKLKELLAKLLLKMSEDATLDDFHNFVQMCFYTINPSTEFKDNWHIKLISEYLSACEKGEIKRLIINMPPRSLKSLLVTVAWPAWLLGKDPSRRIIASSYSQYLSLKHSMDSRLIMNSDWYQEIFPEVEFARGQNEKFKFVTTKRGYRLATSSDGSVTGEGGNFLVVDDPIKPSHIHSKISREHTINWFEQTFATRADDKKKSAFVVVMQRLHEDDLSGYLLKKGNWIHLNIPAIAEEKSVIKFGKFEKIREPGDIIHEGREGKTELERAKIELGSYGFSAQYQQKPVPLRGGIIKSDWLKRYKAPPDNAEIIQSWDTAISSSEKSDFSVCTTWAETKAGYYLLDVFRKQVEYTELKHNVINLAEKWQPKAVLIENKSSGQSLYQDLKRETKLPLIPIIPTKDKVTRMASVSPFFEAGRVFLPEVAKWLMDYEMEILAFPSVSNDDQVDSTSQFLNWTKTKPQGEYRVRVL